MRVLHLLLLGTLAFAAGCQTPPAAPTPPAELQFSADLGLQATVWGDLRVFDRLRPLKTAAPHFPPHVNRQDADGSVLAELLVDERGSVKEAQVIQGSGDSGIDDAALAALRKWRFPVVQADGRPVRYVTRQPIVFAFHHAR